MPARILIVGSSARSAAASARRAGLSPVCIDQFADADTQQLAETYKSSHYPADLPELAAGLPAMPWLYTGALENHPAIISRLASQRPLWGNGEAVLGIVRSPITLSEEMARHGYCFAESVSQLSADATPSEWLHKPFNSGGGRGIRFASSTDAAGGYYFQRYYPGPSYSAVYFSHGGQADLIGLTQQLIGSQPRLGIVTPPFAYCGNIGPISLPCEEELRQLGQWLTLHAGLSGCWGLDFQLQEDRPITVEVNPRYTASVEVLERAYDLQVFDWYVAASSNRPLPRHPGAIQCTVAKLIVYAQADFRFPATGPWHAGSQEYGPRYADIPPAGEACLTGQPVLSLFGSGSWEQAWEQLHYQWQLLKPLLPLHP